MAVVLRKSPRPWMIMREILEYFCNADPQGSARDYYVGPEELYAKEALSMNYRLPEEFRNGLYLRLNLRCKDLGGAGNTNSPRYELEGPKGGLCDRRLGTSILHLRIVGSRFTRGVGNLRRRAKRRFGWNRLQQIQPVMRSTSLHTGLTHVKK
ncbi:uncharacterized protein CIMG_02058 [Coccidioides immitis RS]|uniref:Uncharacterized protein n=1 Tax=Coccidioides immitis (strain RS) TaxID=246410 RepID=J3KKJ5_COCIM|nr:uncharacterized protein CIMG_02058 [Coccidioides immitis RS]EAS36704.3 hypothetical protein CIMG_02058 [Coccidioides immitis RS]